MSKHATNTSLSFTVTATPDDIVVAVRGEVDSSCSALLRERLATELEVGPKALIADLSEVTFCDSSGLSALLETRTEAAEDKVPFLLVTQQRGLLRPITLLHLGTVLSVHPTLQDARAAIKAPATVRAVESVQ